MDFGSEFVYSYSDSEEEEISAEAIETGVDSVPEASAQTLSSAAVRDSGIPRTPPPLYPLPPVPRRATSSSGSIRGPHSSEAGQKWRCADTNVVVVKFDRLTDPSNMHTGDPIVCSGCQAMLSHVSKITNDGEKKIWTCEFCETKNEVEIAPAEMPSKADVTYMLEPSLVAAAGDGGASGKTDWQESIVVFCIDYSGSMSTVVASSGNRRITRMEGVKRAVCHQLEQLAENSPGCRIAVVAFANYVKVIADGIDMREQLIPEDLFNDMTRMLDAASDLGLPSRIGDTRRILTKNVRRESNGGYTALGPGLLISLGIARQMTRSKVIVCTDGMANLGIGSLEDHLAAEVFYTAVANTAKESGVSVSVLTISGTDCKLVELGRVAELTGGKVNIVDPLTATEEFGNILADTFIATHATARFSVHRDLYIRGEAERSSHALRDIGNVIRGTEISFEYGFRRKKQRPKPDGSCQGDKKHEGDDKRDEPDDDSMGAAVVAAPSTTVVTEDDSQKHLMVPTSLPLVSEPSSATLDQDPINLPELQEPSKEHVVQEPAKLPVAEEPEKKSLLQDTAGFSITDKEPSCREPIPKEVPTISDRPIRLPFQVQIRYTDLKGAKAVRVFTETKPITKDRNLAESRINIPILGTHAIQAAANKALNAEYMESRLTDFAYSRMFLRNATRSEDYKQAYELYEQVSEPMKGRVMKAQRVEARSNNSTVMDSEKMLKNVRSDELRRQRRQVFDDSFANTCYMGLKSNTKQFVQRADKPMSKPIPKPALPLLVFTKVANLAAELSDKSKDVSKTSDPLP